METLSTAKRGASTVESVVDALFQVFALVYGSLWLSRWEGLPMDRVKAEWAQQLRGMSAAQERLAVDYIKSHTALPPTLPEFVNVARQFRQTGQTLALVSPRGAMPPNVRDFIADFKKKNGSKRGGPLDHA